MTSAPAQTTTAELSHWRHLQASLDRSPHSQIFDANCYRNGHYQPHLAPPTFYAEQIRREWIANYVSYHRLKQLERWSETDKTAARTLSTMGIDSSSCSHWSGDDKDGQSIYRDIKDQISNG